MTSSSSTAKKKGADSSTFKLKLPEWQPKEYQKKAMRFALERNAAALFLDPGLGKTSITLGVFKVLKAKWMVKRMLVVAPLRVCYATWPGEIKKWKDFEHLTYSILHGKDKEKALREQTDIHVINPEGLEFLLRHHSARSWPYDMLVVDESTMFKNMRATRSKLLNMVTKYFTRRYILTGTPAPNGLLDLYGQIYILDRGASLGRFYSHYRAEHFAPGGFNNYQWSLVKGEDKKIQAKIKDLAIFMDAKDWLELKEPIFNVIRVDLPPKARAIYDTMEDEMFAGLDSGRVKAVNSGVASMKCRQIANGGLYIDAKEGTYEDIHHAKVEVVASLVDELNGAPALISYEFGHDLERLLEALGDPPSSHSLPVKEYERFAAEWRDGKHSVFLGQPASMAHGLNLQGGRAIIFHSLTYNYEHYYQFIRRVHRQGNNGAVVIHLIVARDTVDEVMLATLLRKEKGERAFLEALKRYRLARGK